MDAVIAPNSTVAEWVRAAGFGNVHLVPQFVPRTPEPSSKPSSSRAVLFAGRLADDKGLQVLIPAFARVLERVPDATLVVAGDGPDRARLEEMARAMLKDKVRMLGRITNEDLRVEMERARMVAVPSMMLEAGPLVAIEAAFAGRPVVASDAPGLNELAGIGEFGHVVPRGSIAPLADAIVALLEDPAASDRLGIEARRVAEQNWTLEAGTKKTRAVYERAIESAREKGRLTTAT
jgi:glycosyltransferase involved in cell wall biosynthesis